MKTQMTLEQLLTVEEKLLERALGEFREFTQQQQPPKRWFAQRRSPSVAEQLYSWMSGKFDRNSSIAHPNIALDSLGIDYLTTGPGRPSLWEKENNGKYQANELCQAVIYTLLARRLGLDAFIGINPVEFPALQLVEGMDKPVRTGKGMVYSVAVMEEGREITLIPYYKGAFAVDLKYKGAKLDNNPMLFCRATRSWLMTDDTVANLLNAQHDGRMGNVAGIPESYDDGLGVPEELFEYASALRNSSPLPGLQKAARLLTKALETDPHHEKSKSLLETINQRISSEQAELSHAEAKAANNPEDGDAALHMAYLLRRAAGDERGYALAEEQLRKGNYKFESRWFELAEDYYEQKGDAHKAVSLLEEAVRRHPGHWVLKYQLGNQLFALGEWEEAARQLEQGIAGHFSHTSDNYFGVAHAIMGNPEQAEKHFRKALQQMPVGTEIRRNLAITLFWSGKFNEARKELLEIALSEGVKDVGALAYLGLAYQMLGMNKAAKQWYQAASTINPAFWNMHQPILTGFRPEMSPVAHDYTSLDFTTLFSLDKQGSFEAAQDEAKRLEQEAGAIKARELQTRVHVNNAYVLPDYMRLLEMRKAAQSFIGMPQFFDQNFPTLDRFSQGGGSYDADEVRVFNRIGDIELSTATEKVWAGGVYTAIRQPERPGDRNKLIAAVATEETEAAITEELARKDEPLEKKLVIEDIHGKLGLGPNTGIDIYSVVGNVTGEVGRIHGKITTELGDVSLTIREPVHVRIARAKTVSVSNMDASGKNDFFPPGRRADYTLEIASLGNVSVAYKPHAPSP